MNRLLAISPLDGRYSGRLDDLNAVVSEFGLIKLRVFVEIEWLKKLVQVLPDVQDFSDGQMTFLDNLYQSFSPEHADRIKEIEQTTNHDVKAVEYWLREMLDDSVDLSGYREFIHFGRTSDDINNVAYALMLRSVRQDYLLPLFDKIGARLEALAHDFAHTPLLSMTHGQPAVPTTFGKEMAVFVERLSNAAGCFGTVDLKAKLNGASGTYGAETFAYPEVDWKSVSSEFISGLGLHESHTTTQIESHDYVARYLNELTLACTILQDLAVDMWLYISRNIIRLQLKDNEVGSSAMPHKVNPIDFENAESNFDTAIGMARQMAVKLPRSRMQRDLSDSSTLRNLGSVIGYAIIGLKSTHGGLLKVVPNEEAMANELEPHWDVLTENIQTIMRKSGAQNGYEVIKDLSRGKKFDRIVFADIVSSLEIPDEDKKRLLALTPLNCLGLAPEIALTAKYSRE